MSKKAPACVLDEIPDEVLQKWAEARDRSRPLSTPHSDALNDKYIYELSEKLGNKLWRALANELNHDRIPSNEVIAHALRQPHPVPEQIRSFLAEYIEDKLPRKLGRRSSYDPRRKEYRWRVIEVFDAAMDKYDGVPKAQLDHSSAMNLALEEVQQMLKFEFQLEYKIPKVKKIVYEDCKGVREANDPNHPRFYEEPRDDPKDRVFEPAKD